MPLRLRLRLRLSVYTALFTACATLCVAPVLTARADLPAGIGDQEFWHLTETLSEPDGFFRSENLVSNELVFPMVVPELVNRTRPGGVYLGVGPEQNFTYIAAMKPRLAFVLDIRRGNLCLQLLYKALFELSPNRAAFVARLFNLKAIDDVGTVESAVSASDLFRAYGKAPMESEAVYRANLSAVRDVLVERHGFPLSEEDLQGIESVYGSFRLFGPMITWSSTANGNPGGRATYLDLMLQADPAGRALSYLASEDSFAFVKDLEARNMVIPVVGDFGGPKALRGIGRYLKEHGATVTAFYLSNVESYLRQDNKWQAFCGNVATMPLDDASVFVRPSGFPAMRTASSVSGATSGMPLGFMAAEVKGCLLDGTR